MPPLAKPQSRREGTRYALVTPARNEAAFLEQTIQSVVAQTILPERWVIVSDGSTDGTDAIVESYAAKHPWIELVRMPERRERHFAGKVRAFNAGYARLEGVPYDVIGNLDADITMEPDYFEFLLAKFVENPQLGVGGTPFREKEMQYDYRFTSVEHVSGACQLFRRKCFEEIGGYVPVKLGGIDLVAVIKARMKGWQTRSFLDKSTLHHRQMGTANRGVLMVAWKSGEGDYRLGTHPLWEFSRTFYQVTRPPVLIGGIFRLAGFAWAMILREGKTIPDEVVQFRRKEQMQRLRDFCGRLVSRRRLHPEPS